MELPHVLHCFDPICSIHWTPKLNWITQFFYRSFFIFFKNTIIGSKVTQKEFFFLTQLFLECRVHPSHLSSFLFGCQRSSHTLLSLSAHMLLSLIRVVPRPLVHMAWMHQAFVCPHWEFLLGWIWRNWPERASPCWLQHQPNPGWTWLGHGSAPWGPSSSCSSPPWAPGYSISRGLSREPGASTTQSPWSWLVSFTFICTLNWKPDKSCRLFSCLMSLLVCW